MLVEQLEEVLRQKFSEADWQDYFLIELSISPNKLVEIVVDTDEGIRFEQCQKLSRWVENWLDTEGVLGEEYTLEVTSPGVSRPFKFPRQYPRNIGRTLEVVTTEGGKIEGLLTAADAIAITLTFETVRKEGKKKIKEMETVVVPFEQIKSALVVIKF
jgi:ribosome maturation factor RimP